MSSGVLNIRRRRSKVSQDTTQKRTDYDVLEQALDGDNFRVSGTDFTKPKSRSVTFDLTANRSLFVLGQAFREGNTMLCRVGLMAIRKSSESKLTEAFEQTKTTKGMAARRSLTPVELKEIDSFPTNRTLGMTPFDNMLLVDLAKKHGKDVSHLYRAGLYLINKLPKDELIAFISEAPKSKRGAPKRKLS